MEDKDQYRFYFVLHVVFVFIYLIFNIIEILLEGSLQNTILGVVFLSLLITRFGKPYGRFFMGMGLVMMSMDALIYASGEMTAKVGLVGSMFESAWLTIMGCSGYLINSYHPKRCSDCGALIYRPLHGSGWKEYTVRKRVKSKNLIVCGECLGNEFWKKLDDLEEDKEHYLPFEGLTELRKSKWFIPSVELTGAGVFAVFGMIDMAIMFACFTVFAYVMNNYYHKKKSDFKDVE